MRDRKETEEEEHGEESKMKSSFETRNLVLRQNNFWSDNTGKLSQ